MVSDHAAYFFLNHGRKFFDIFLKHLELLVSLYIFFVEHFFLFLCFLNCVFHSLSGQLKLLVSVEQDLSLLFEEAFRFLEFVFLKPGVLGVEVCHLVSLELFRLEHDSIDEFVLALDDFFVIAQ